MHLPDRGRLEPDLYDLRRGAARRRALGEELGKRRRVRVYLDEKGRLVNLLFTLFVVCSKVPNRRGQLNSMDAEALVLAILAALPNREVRGKKRLQKLAFFATQTGTSASVRFSLRDFGPFSSEVAAATELLSWVGAISEKEAQLTRIKRFYKIYSLPEAEAVDEELPGNAIVALKKLNKYTTIELEIASTIRYLMSKGYLVDNAIRQTEELKPTKSAPKIIDRAMEALSEVGLYERGRTDQVSSTRSD